MATPRSPPTRVATAISRRTPCKATCRLHLHLHLHLQRAHRGTRTTGSRKTTTPTAGKQTTLPPCSNNYKHKRTTTSGRRAMATLKASRLSLPHNRRLGRHLGKTSLSSRPPSQRYGAARTKTYSTPLTSST